MRSGRRGDFLTKDTFRRMLPCYVMGIYCVRVMSTVLSGNDMCVEFLSFLTGFF